MRKAKGKLTLVSIYCNGRKLAAFIHLPLVNGKPRLSMELMNKMLRELNCDSRGTTFSIGV